MMMKKWNKKLFMIWKAWGFSLVVALLVATSFRSAIADWNDIPSGSMKPTILIGDRVFVNKLAYDLKVPYTTLHFARWADPQRGDIVVFYSPKDRKRLIKRVVGLPGDTLAMVKNRLYINGQFVKYESLDKEIVNQFGLDQQSHYNFFNENLKGKQHAVMFLPSRPSLNTFDPIIIPEGHYFMMGDNRDNSADSRFFGFVDRKLIVGRATMVVISRDGSFFHPRWRRFFRDLA
jgi:signal peptidase I